MTGVTRRNLLSFYSVDAESNPLKRGWTQHQYLMAYLDGLGVKTIVEESMYFDRDFLSEYAALYGTTSSGMPNFCRRLHFFTDHLTEVELDQALAQDQAARHRFQSAYAGFVVYRPLPNTPLGRTVVPWYPDRLPQTPRVIQPSRVYTAHLCGLPLRVTGLAWQQQDGGVSACASVAIWTILHSSAFSDSHAIPTIAEITRSANQASSSGKRMFPSGGLNQAQIADALRSSNLDPLIIDPLIEDSESPSGIFSQPAFARSCSALIRSGYPVLLVVKLQDEVHSVCVVGFRDVFVNEPEAGTVRNNDEQITHFYIHDDNLGPGVRYRLETVEAVDSSTGQPHTYAQLVPEAPEGKEEVFADTAEPLLPLYMVAAVHQEMRLNITDLHDMGRLLSQMLLQTFSDPTFGLNVSVKIMFCADYLSAELPRLLGDAPSALTAVTRALAAQPLSLHLGIIRLSVGAAPVADIIIDTTTPKPNARGMAHVIYDAFYSRMFQRYETEIYPEVGETVRLLHLGDRIQAW